MCAMTMLVEKTMTKKQTTKKYSIPMNIWPARIVPSPPSSSAGALSETADTQRYDKQCNTSCDRI